MLSVYSKHRAYGARRCPTCAIISSYKAFTQLRFLIHRIKHDALYVMELQDSHEVVFWRYMICMPDMHGIFVITVSGKTWEIAKGELQQWCIRLKESHCEDEATRHSKDLCTYHANPTRIFGINYSNTNTGFEVSTRKPRVLNELLSIYEQELPSGWFLAFALHGLHPVGMNIHKIF